MNKMLIRVIYGHSTIAEYDQHFRVEVMAVISSVAVSDSFVLIFEPTHIEEVMVIITSNVHDDVVTKIFSAFKHLRSLNRGVKVYPKHVRSSDPKCFEVE